MHFPLAYRTAILVTALCLCGQAQNPQGTESRASQVRGIPPRATPGDYQAHAEAGKATIAAESLGHSIPRPQGSPLVTEDYVVIETGLFGPAGAHLTISYDDFSLRINDKKNPQSSQPFGMVYRSLKDPDWVPPESADSKSKSSFSTGGQGGNEPPPPVHMPLELQRAAQQRVQKAALPQGDRVLPEAGLIFFNYHGKIENIHSMELMYHGPAGNATLELQP